MRKMQAILTGMTLVALTACDASGGNQSMKNATATSVNSNIHDGVTTADQVRQIYGTPQETSYEGGNEVWDYNFGASTSDGLSIAQKAVGLGFLGTRNNISANDLLVTIRNGVVISHRFSTKSVNANSGLRQ